MTLREQLAQDYPLHYQRIVEYTYSHYRRQDADDLLRSHERVRPLGDCLIWASTEEGWEYWRSLADGPFA